MKQKNMPRTKKVVIAPETPEPAKKPKRKGSIEIPATLVALTNKQLLRLITKSFYSLQKERIRFGNRIAAQWKAKMGIKPGTKEEDRAAEDALVAKILDFLHDEFKKVLDGIKALQTKTRKNDRIPLTPETFQATPLFSTWTEALIFQLYLDLEAQENRMKEQLKNYLPPFKIYAEFLSKVHGLGPCSSAILLSWLDIHKATHVSDIWKYCGLAVRFDVDGKADSQRKEHLESIAYINKEGNPDTKMGIRYVPFLKSKLLTVIGDGLIRAGNARYRPIYDDYRNRLDTSCDTGGKWANTTKKHRHYAARRYMVKQFLLDLYIVWRQLEGLPVSRPWEEVKLGLQHSKVRDITIAYGRLSKAKDVAEAGHTEAHLAASEAAEVDLDGPDIEVADD